MNFAMEEMLKRVIARTSSLQDLADVLDAYLDSVEINVVDGKETISIKIDRVLVQRFGSSRIEIRPKEQCHNIPHFHYKGPNIDASFRIDNCNLIVGTVDRRDLRKIQRFFNVDGGRQRLVEIWDRTRPG